MNNPRGHAIYMYQEQRGQTTAIWKEEAVSVIREEILTIFPERLQKILRCEVSDWNRLQEIRIRCKKKMVMLQERKKYVPEQGNAGVSEREFREIIEHISRYSLYAFEEEVRKGYLTIPGGHRIGLAGKVIMENGRVKTMRNITFLNVRVSHERIGCSDELLPHLFEGKHFLSTLIVSPPGAGKTTLLRDLVRNLAGENRYTGGMTVSVVDERSEIAGCYGGIPQKDVGLNCDVMDGCDKREGIRMMLRAMAPEVIAVDEIGAEGDFEIFVTALTSGCRLVATVHGSSLADLREKTAVHHMMREGMFERIVFLDENFSHWIKKICDGRGEVVL